MPQRTILRFSRWLTVLGTALVITGCFFPLRIVSVSSISYGTTSDPEIYVTSFLSIFVNSANTFMKYSLLGAGDLILALFLVVIFFQLLTSIAVLRNLLDTPLLVLNLIGGVLGILDILFVLIMPTGWFHTLPTITVGPGFWLMLSGFLLCIVISVIVIRMLESPVSLASESPARRETHTLF